jgi:hypothetical protein
MSLSKPRNHYQSVSRGALKAAVARIVCAAFDELKVHLDQYYELEPRIIRKALETEFSCCLKSERDLIMATMFTVWQHKRLVRQAAEIKSNNKSAKQSAFQSDADEFVSPFPAAPQQKCVGSTLVSTKTLNAAFARLVPAAEIKNNNKSAKQSAFQSDADEFVSPFPAAAQQELARPSLVSTKTLTTAVARLVRAAVNARQELSAPGIRRSLEIEFSCDLSSRKTIIMRSIHAALKVKTKSQRADKSS